MPVADLQRRRHPKNPNTHTEKQIRILAKIIEKQGWRAPIVVSNRSGLIVAGHARLAAAMLLGYTEAPVDFQDFESEELELAHLVADNTIPEMAEMDGDVLQGILTELDMAGIDAELAGIVKSLEAAKVKPEKTLPEKSVFEVVVECDSEAHQKQLFDKFKTEGLQCRLLTL
jgi:ParB-like chromosome segregation protein Spo0J